jgi:phage terminase small subunit
VPNLTQRQQIFADAVIRGQNPTDAARAAGYGTEGAFAGQTGYRLMRTPSVAAAIRERHSAMIGEMVPRSLKVLDRIIQDDEAPAAARVRGVQLILIASGHINARGQAEPDGTAKFLSEMTPGELERAALEQRECLTNALRAVEDLQRELAAQANTIEASAILIEPHPEAAGPDEPDHYADELDQPDGGGRSMLADEPDHYADSPDQPDGRNPWD